MGQWGGSVKSTVLSTFGARFYLICLEFPEFDSTPGAW